MAAKLGYSVEPIENGFLVHIEVKTEGWVPDAEKEKPMNIAGVEITPSKTWFAKDKTAIDLILKYQYYK